MSLFHLHTGFLVAASGYALWLILAWAGLVSLADTGFAGFLAGLMGALGAEVRDALDNRAFYKSMGIVHTHSVKWDVFISAVAPGTLMLLAHWLLLRL